MAKKTKTEMSTQLAAAMIAIQSGVPPILWGKPGTGKTSWINLIAELMDYHAETVIASIREPADFAGLPVIQTDGSVKLATPNWAKRLIDNDNKTGLLFLDELSTAPPAVQAALLRVVFERVVGDERLPSNTLIVAAANPTETTGGTWTLNAALANRFVHLDWGVTAKEWVEGMMNGWQKRKDVIELPEDWQDYIPQARTLVTSFINHRPVNLLQEPENTEDAGRAWASPRSWENAARLLAACESVGMGDTVKLTLITGSVGKGPATEFMTWVRNLDLQDPQMLLSNPKAFKMPKTGDKVFAVLSAVVTAALNDEGQVDKDNWEAAWNILGQAAKADRADIAAIPAKTLARARTSDCPIPKDIKEFLPVLSAAGLIG